jgi:hypothetical protein
MAEQLDFFAAAPVLPAGLKYQREVITPEVEQSLLAVIRDLPFEEFEFKGYVGNRRTVSFGADYDFSREQLAPAEPMPAYLLSLRDTAAAFAGLPAEHLQQVLVTEYWRCSAK